MKVHYIHTLRAFIKRMIKMLLHCTLHSGQKYPKCLINILRYKLPKNFFTSWKSSKSIFELKKWKNITLEKWTFFYILAHCAESVLLHRLSRNTGSYLGVTRRLISICVLISVMIVILRYTPPELKPDFAPKIGDFARGTVLPIF